jgi:Cytochrome P450
MWLMSEAKGVEKSVEALARRFLLLNMSSVQPTSLVSGIAPTFDAFDSYSRMRQTVIRVLYRLLSHPEYIEPLREEVEAVVAEEGWTRAGMDKMRKLDSFLRETQRIDPESIGPLASSRCLSVADIFCS